MGTLAGGQEHLSPSHSRTTWRKVLVSRRNQHWSALTKSGADYELRTGPAGTSAAPGVHRRQFYPSPGTLILGADRADNHNVACAATANWLLPVPPKRLQTLEPTFVAIGAIRQYGGLHSRIYDASANILLNGVPLDRIGLRVQSEGHSDYFHRPPLTAGFPEIEPFASCATLYTWKVQAPHWSPSVVGQRISLELDPEVVWDIDHIGLIYAAPSRIFISYSHADAHVARRLYRGLSKIGAAPWIDTQELKIGESLISRLQAAIGGVDYVFALISENSVRSRWVQRELEVAMTQEINGLNVVVVPIRLDDCELPLFLAGKIYGDLRPPRRYASLMRQTEALLASDHSDAF
jgi:hypothetical protein